MNLRGLLSGGSATLLSGMGLVHILATGWFYSALSLDALWFAGSGLAILLLGILNLLRLRDRDPLLRSVGLFANLLGVILLVLLCIVLGEPQAWVTLTFAVVQLLDCAWVRFGARPGKDSAS